MRFSRDKRGYENTFIVHAGGGRRRGKPRSRILYWFHTPPGVRVGRSALDEEAIRLIEAHNPDVQFDWTRILKGAGEERRAAERPQREPAIVPPTAQVRPVPAAPAPTPEIEELDENDEAERQSEQQEEEPRVVEAKLGPEGLARLRARHAEMLARISEGVQDPAKREELKARAERLNPDTWVTDAEVAAGLESYEAEFEALRTAAGRRRRRRRSRRPRSDQAPVAAPDDGTAARVDDTTADSDEDETPEPEAG